MAGNTFILKLTDNADVLEELRKLVSEQRITYAFVENASGRLKEFQLVSHAPNGRVETNYFKDACELNAMHGKIQRAQGEFVVNVRVLASRTGFTGVSGQLLKGKADGELIIELRKVDMSKMIEA
ncbi:MAG: DUF296 domain-containing protein [Candidatus Diapherotrites archaeon]|nr:DUF296 domain-containing protein [Candidatus Diapherotrites archaeon]